MSLTELLPYLSLPSIVSLLIVFGVGVVAALALLGLRFARRGPARFWLAPSFVTLACLPLVAGAGLAALGLVYMAQAVGFVGSGTTVAVQAGVMEAELPLLLGFLGTAGVAGLGLALLAVGRSGPAASPSRESASVVPPAVAVALSGISLGLALAFYAGAQWLATSPSSATVFARALAWSAAGVSLLVPVTGFTLALRAPRGSVPAHVRALSLGTVGVLVACALAAAAVRIAWLQRTPLGEGSAVATEPIESPELLQGESGPVEGDLASAPPPPAPARVASKPIPPLSRPGAVATPVQPLRVGGPIREPKKLKNVPPAYPAAALQARLQGTRRGGDGGRPAVGVRADPAQRGSRARGHDRDGQLQAQLKG